MLILLYSLARLDDFYGLLVEIISSFCVTASGDGKASLDKALPGTAQFPVLWV